MNSRIRTVFAFVTAVIVIPSAVQALTLGDALDAPELMWWCTPGAPWQPQTNDTFDGIDSALFAPGPSPNPDKIGKFKLGTFVVGPGVLSFRYRVNVFAGAYGGISSWIRLPSLELVMGTQVVETLTETNSWRECTVSVPAGSHALNWQALRGYNISNEGTCSFNLDQVSWTGSLYSPDVKNDFDGDGITDIGVYYGPTGIWYLMQSRDGYREIPFGFSATVPVTGDYDGDHRTDPAVYCATTGNWYFMCSSAGFRSFGFGFPGTIPFSADFDGDGRDDFGVYYPPTGMWYIMCSQVGFRRFNFGFSGTVPLSGDFDGDGKADLGLFCDRTGEWYRMMSRDGFRQQTFGFPGVQPLVGDFDGDFRDDIAVVGKLVNDYDPSAFIMQSRDGFTKIPVELNENILHVIYPHFADHSGRAVLGVYAWEPQYNSAMWLYIEGGVNVYLRDPFGFAGAVPVMSPLVGGMAVDYAYRDGVPLVGGTIKQGMTPVLNGHVTLLAEPSDYYDFLRWSDGNRQQYRSVPATGRSVRYAAVFKYRLEGRWSGRSGMTQAPTYVTFDSFWNGDLVWPGGDRRQIRRFSDHEGYVPMDFDIEGGDIWRLRFDGHDRLTGVAIKPVRDADGNWLKTFEYPIELFRQ